MVFIEKQKNRWKILRESQNPLKLLFAYILRRLHLSHFFIIDKYSYKMRFYPSALLMHYWVNPNIREDETIFLRRLVKYGSVVLDIGANVGTLTLPLACQVGSRGKVYSIEASPKTFRYLKGNVELNTQLNNIILFNTAIGDKCGIIHFSNLSSDDMNNVVGKDVPHAFEVPVSTLDDIKRSNGITKIRLLKVDIEGYEPFAFMGAKETLNITEIVFFESWEEHFRKYGYSTVDVIGILKRHGFFVYKINKDYSLKEIDSDYISLECENLIAFKSKEFLRCIYENIQNENN
ncbi:FkbM family methyltransferase [Nitratifractor sp.]